MLTTGERGEKKKVLKTQTLFLLKKKKKKKERKNKQDCNRSYTGRVGCLAKLFARKGREPKSTRWLCFAPRTRPAEPRGGRRRPGGGGPHPIGNAPSSVPSGILAPGWAELGEG